MLDQPLTRTSPLSATEDITAVAARCANDAEAQRRLDPEVVKGLLSAGFARHFVPVSCGGNAGTFQELARAVSTIGEACAATAWCASLMANLSRMVAFLPAEGYQEIWADGPDPLIVGSLMPTGRAEPVAGGWWLSGQWPYISAVDFSDWALVCGLIPATGQPEVRMFAIPRAAYGILDTWFNVGMRATGSNTLVVENCFVPAARSYNREDLFTGHALDSTAACHSVPLQAVNGLSFATPTLGAARGALNSWLAFITEKIRAASTRPGMPGVNRASYDLTLARCAGEIDAAQLLLERAAINADQGGSISPLHTAQNLRDCALAVDMLVTTVNRLFRAAGTTGQSAANPIQRFWRDVNSAASHIALQFEPAANAYGSQLIPI